MEKMKQRDLAEALGVVVREKKEDSLDCIEFSIRSYVYRVDCIRMRAYLMPDLTEREVLEWNSCRHAGALHEHFLPSSLIRGSLEQQFSHCTHTVSWYLVVVNGLQSQ